MKFGPSLYQPMLTFGQFTRYEIHWRDAVYPHMFLIIRMKVGHMMWRVRLSIHSNYDSKKPTEFWHF